MGEDTGDQPIGEHVLNGIWVYTFERIPYRERKRSFLCKFGQTALYIPKSTIMDAVDDGMDERFRYLTIKLSWVHHADLLTAYEGRRPEPPPVRDGPLRLVFDEAILNASELPELTETMDEVRRLFPKSRLITVKREDKS